MLLDITLVIEELLVNTITHGYPQGGDGGEIELRLSSTAKTIKIVIKDNGIPFNMLDAEKPDINLPLKERKIGGMGIHLVKSLTDKITYERKNGKNILTLIVKKK